MKQRHKNIVLIVGFVLILMLGYRMTIAKTLVLKAEVTQLQTEAKALTNLDQRTSNLEQKERYLDSILAQKNLTNNSLQNNLLSFLTKESDKSGFSISEFKEPHVIVKDNLTQTSYQFTLKGTYKHLEKVLYQLEQRESFGRLVHIDFKKERDHRKGRDFLEVAVIVRTVQ